MFEYVKKFLLNYFLKVNEASSEILINNFYNEILSPEDEDLIKLAFSLNPSQRDLDNLLNKWDIEKKGSNKSLLLAYIMKKHPNLRFNSYCEPRLRGLLYYYRFHNLQLFSHFVKVGRILNDNNIYPLILKGISMKYLRPELPRIMGDVDILVLKKNFFKSVELIKSLGYWYIKAEPHSIDFHFQNSNESVIDVHSFLPFDIGYCKKFHQEIFKRAKLTTAFNIKCYMPSCEDILFILLTNLYRNLKDKTSRAGILLALFDFNFLINSKSDFNWDIVKKNAILTKNQVQINLALGFIRKISPYLIPEYIKNDMFFDKDVKLYSLNILFEKYYLDELRLQCSKIPLKTIFKSKNNFFSYLKLKPKFYLLKLLINHPFLIMLIIQDLNTKKFNIQNKVL